jgi:hypothetical protein
LCCLLFLLNIAGMIYCTIHAYINGNPNNIYKSIGDNQRICGNSTSGTAEYPFIYFYNPLEGISSRYCMKGCPYFDINGTLTIPECYSINITGPGCSVYHAIVQKNGNFTGNSAPNPYNGLYIGYETKEVLNRICLPTLTVLTNALQNYTAQLKSALQQESFASFTMDVQNVIIYFT